MKLRRTAAVAVLALSAGLTGVSAAHAETAVPADAPIAERPMLQSGKLAVERFVFQQEEEAGIDLWDLDFTGPHEVTVQIMPEAIGNSDADARLDKLKEVLATNGYTEAIFWAVGPAVSITDEEFFLD